MGQGWIAADAQWPQPPRPVPATTAAATGTAPLASPKQLRCPSRRGKRSPGFAAQTQVQHLVVPIKGVYANCHRPGTKSANIEAPSLVNDTNNVVEAVSVALEESMLVKSTLRLTGPAFANEPTKGAGATELPTLPPDMSADVEKQAEADDGARRSDVGLPERCGRQRHGVRAELARL